MIPDNILSKPFISVSEYRKLIQTPEHREKSIKILRLLNAQYPGLIFQKGKKEKIWISVQALLEICPALAKRYQLNSSEFRNLQEQIHELQREIDELKI